MRQKIFYSTVVILIIYASLVFAVPGIPHQFYGNIKVNDLPVPDNTVIVATVEGDTYTTITTDSKYGYSPNIFYVEDPDGDRAGSTIIFSIGGMDVGTHVFEDCIKDWNIPTNCYDELNFDVTTFCGDGYCLGDETCSSCPGDCGYCTGPPVITIHSPENNKVYSTLKVDLDVSADQEIIVWMYSLNTAAPITFTPNITITAQEGNNSINVIGINNVYQSGTKTVSFSVELPECGNGNLDEGEECDGSDFGTQTCSSYGFNSGSLSCTANCTIDSSGCYNSGVSGGGGGGGGGSSCTPKWECTAWTECLPEGTMTRICTDKNNCRTTAGKPVESQLCNYVPPKTTTTQEKETEPETISGEPEPAPVEEPPVTETVVTDTSSGFGRITGMFFQNITGENKWVGIGIIILILLVGWLFYFFGIKKKRKKE